MSIYFWSFKMDMNRYIQSSKKYTSALQYLLQADDDERRRWGERAVALGYKCEVLLTEATIYHICPWIDFVRQEMMELGLWEPHQNLS
jgi:hypothetical protein